MRAVSALSCEQQAWGRFGRVRRILGLAAGLLLGVTTAQAYREATVAADGSGHFETVQAAVDAVPDHHAELHLIHIRPGVYREIVKVSREKGPIKFLGQDAATTVLSFDNDATTLDSSGKAIGTFRSASVFIESNDFSAEGITFENTYGEGSQALAINVSGDRSTFRNCRFLGWQDTMLLKRGRQYFENCFIAGHVDFIFGGAKAYFESCEIYCLGDGYITAASTDERQEYGFVFSNCRIRGASAKVKTYLGRPWRPFAKVVFMNCELSRVVREEGWQNWGNPENEKTARYYEYGNTGPGANLEGRVGWSRVLSRPEARSTSAFTVLNRWDPNHALTLERISSLPEATRMEWEAYLSKSQARQSADRAALDEELAANQLKQALKPPSGAVFKLGSHSYQSWYRSDEAKELTETILSYQTPSGGWSKNIDLKAGPRQPGMQWSASASSKLWHYVGTFDNRATTEHLRYLALVYSETRQNRVRDAFFKGLDYILEAQFPNGGWPQGYPLEGGYHDNITFNDNAMLNVLELLRDIAAREAAFGFVDSNRRDAAKQAMESGIHCLLDAQVMQGGRPTVWCAQHDPISLEAVAARRMEPASLSGGESAEIVRFLMDLDGSSRTIDRAVDDARAWFKRSRITGLRETEREGRVFYEEDRAATEVLWARFYDLETNEPMFSGAEDGLIYDTFEAMWQTNPVHYDFYTSRPMRLFK